MSILYDIHFRLSMSSNNANQVEPAIRLGVAAKSSSSGLLWHQFSGAVDQLDEFAPVTSLIQAF